VTTILLLSETTLTDHDVRRIAGTNDFELIGLDWPGTVRSNAMGGG